MVFVAPSLHGVVCGEYIKRPEMVSSSYAYHATYLKDRADQEIAEEQAKLDKKRTKRQ
jgi:hypothetical protein